MRTSAVKIYVDKFDRPSDSRITYSLNRQLKNGRVRKKVILHFKLKGKETYRNSLAFLGMNKSYKWWFRSAGLLRLEDSLK